MKKIGWIPIILLVVLFAQSACSVFETENEPVIGQGAVVPTAPANMPEKPEEQAKQVVASGSFNPQQFAEMLGNFVLRPEDLPNEYRIPPGGEKRVSNLGVIQQMGEVKGKRYIVDTGRVEGWYLKLERKRKEDIAPYVFESSLDVFETNEGAQLAISPAWYKMYAEDSETSNLLEDGCELGDECLFYYYESLDPATNLTTLRYHVAFVYNNVLVWVMGRGLDIDTNPDYVMDAANTLYDKLENAYLAYR